MTTNEASAPADPAKVALILERARLLDWQHRFQEYDQGADRLAEINAQLRETK